MKKWEFFWGWRVLSSALTIAGDIELSMQSGFISWIFDDGERLEDEMSWVQWANNFPGEYKWFKSIIFLVRHDLVPCSSAAIISLTFFVTHNPCLFAGMSMFVIHIFLFIFAGSSRALVHHYFSGTAHVRCWFGWSESGCFVFDSLGISSHEVNLCW